MLVVIVPLLLVVTQCVQRPRPIIDYKHYHSHPYKQPSKIDLSQYQNQDQRKTSGFLNKFLNAPELRAQFELESPGPRPGLCPITPQEGTSLPVIELIHKSLKLSGMPVDDNYDVFLSDGIKLNKHSTLDDQNVAHGAELIVKASAPAGGSENELLKSIAKEGCDPTIEGVEACAESDEDAILMTEIIWRIAVCMVVILTVLLAIAAALQTILRFVIRRLLRFEDKYMNELIENAFRQVAVIAVALSLLHLIETSWFLQYKLGAAFFVVQFGGEGIKFVFRLFVATREYVENFTLIYASFVVLFAVVAFRNFRQLRRAEELQVEDIIVNFPKPFYLSYLVARYEYVEWMKAREIAALDPQNFWFMEYHRACLISVCSELIRLPVSALLLLLVSIWFALPLSLLFGRTSVLVCLSLLSLPSVLLIGILFRAKQVKNKLLPKDLVRYVQVRHQMELSTNDKDFKDALAENQPRYKLNASRRPLKRYGFIEHVLLGTREPNKHEALFYFWRRGPSILVRLSELGFLTAMSIISFIGRESTIKADLWWNVYLSWPILIVVALIGCLCGLLPSVIDDLTYISSTHLLIKENIWLDVVITNRAKFVRRLTLLTDGLKSEIYLTSLLADKNNVFDKLRETNRNLSPEVQAQRDQFWSRLTVTGKLSAASLFKFFNDKGFNLADVSRAEIWINAFKGKGGDDSREDSTDMVLSRSEFDMMMTVLTEVLKEPLEETDVRDLLHSWMLRSNEDVGVDEVEVILKKLNLKWSVSEKLHLITFSAKHSNARMISFDQFVQALIDIDQSTLGTLNVAVNRLKHHQDSPQRLFAEEPELM